MSSEEENGKRKVLEEKRKIFKNPAFPNRKLLKITVPIKIKKLKERELIRKVREFSQSMNETWKVAAQVGTCFCVYLKKT